MEGFDTISLESNSCDICKQDTGEELIDCILNDRCLQVSESSVDTGDTDTEPYKRAHKDCLVRWKSVIKASFKCPSPKRSWKDRIKDLLNRNVEETNVNNTWFQVDIGSKQSTRANKNFKTFNSNSNQNNNKTNSEKNDFLTNEQYRIERNEDGIGCCEERARKLRVCSIDKEDEDKDFEEVSNDLIRDEEDVFQTSWTLAQLGKMQTAEIQEIHAQIKRRIEEVSTLLISELQEKDSLRQQADSLHTTVAQLVKLQQKQNVKTLSLDFEQRQHHLVT